MKEKKKSLRDPSYTLSLDRQWLGAIRQRFADREDIGRERVYELYFETQGLPKEQVFECFDLIETEYGYIGGLLRPDDSLEKLFKKVPTRNPFHWARYEIMAGDRQVWFGEELEKRLRKYGVRKYADWPRVDTIGDFVSAWCGKVVAS